MRGHLVHKISHVELCDGLIERAREMRPIMDMSESSFGLEPVEPQ